MKRIEKIIQSSVTPNTSDSLWLDDSNPNSPELKAQVNGVYKSVVGQGGSLPTGGTKNQVIVKNSDKDGDVIWKNDQTAMCVNTPQSRMTLEELIDCGFTSENLEAAAEHKITCVFDINYSSNYIIERVFYTSPTNWSIAYSGCRADGKFVRYNVSVIYITSEVGSISVSCVPLIEPYIELSGLPTEEMDSISDLNDIGIDDNIIDAVNLRGVTTIRYDGAFYTITLLSGVGVHSCHLVFSRFWIENSTVKGIEYDITTDVMSPTSVTVAIHEV